MELSNLTKGRIDAAGAVLADADASATAQDEALTVLNTWRSAHSSPLEAMEAETKRRVAAVAKRPLTVRRLKRVESIVAKLRRFPNMKLSRMQDLGGCRAVLRDTPQARRAWESFLSSDSRHQLVRSDDYIGSPKKDGYRGLHLVYRYYGADRSDHDGLQVEIQLRSALQHAWATAVETVGILLDTPLKSNVGPAQWKRFFALASAAFALRERTAPVPDLPTDIASLRSEMHQLERGLNVRETLQAFGLTLQVASTRGTKGEYYLMALDSQKDSLSIQRFEPKELTRAQRTYLKLEKNFADKPGALAVLVAAASFDSLKEAYPNFFLDTDTFVATVADILMERRRPIATSRRAAV